MEWRLIERSDELRHAVSAANQQHHVRRRVFVQLREDETVGWGEVSPLEQSVLADPSFDEVFSELATVALANFCDIRRREGAVPLWSRSAAIARNSAASRWAHAAIEMAVLDWELQRSSTSLAQQWGVEPDVVEPLATVSVLDSEGSWQIAPGTRRLRVKTTAGVDLARFVEALEVLSLPVLLDFNASAHTSDEVVRQLDALAARVEIVAVEQPFAPGDLISHAELAQRIDVAVGLDESVRSVLDVRRIARYQAASLICVKPPRVGGLAVARSMLASAHELGLRTYVGGFFESPLGRFAHRTLAALGGSEASDVANAVVLSGGRYATRTTGIGIFPVLTEQEALSALHVN